MGNFIAAGASKLGTSGGAFRDIAESAERIKGSLTAMDVGDTITLPSSALLTKYNIDPKNLFTIKMTAYEVPTLKVDAKVTGKKPVVKFPYKPGADILSEIGTDFDNLMIEAKASTIDRLDINFDIQNSSTQLPIASFVTIHNQETFAVNHSHNYEDSLFGGLASTVNKLSDVIPGVNFGNLQEGVKFIKDVATKAQGGQANFRLSSSGGFDVAPVYKGSQQRSINVSFVLVSQIDPWLEVILPSQLLSFLSYPHTMGDSTPIRDLFSLMTSLRHQIIKDNTTSGLGGALNQISNAATAVSNIIGKKQTQGKDGKAVASGFEAQVNQAIQGFQDTFYKNAKTPQSFRFKIGSPPPMWDIQTSNHTQDIRSAYLKDVNITYHGPWIQRPVVEDDKTKAFNMLATTLGAVGTLTGNGFGGIAKSTIPSAVDMGIGAYKGAAGLFSPAQSKDSSGFMEGAGLPSWAEVNLTFVSNFKDTFAEEVLFKSPAPTFVKFDAISSLTGIAKSIL